MLITRDEYFSEKTNSIEILIMGKNINAEIKKYILRNYILYEIDE